MKLRGLAARGRAGVWSELRRGAPPQVCPAQAITIEAEEREDGSRRTTRCRAC